VTGYYLYGFVTAEAARTPFEAAVPFAAAVTLVAYQDITAVVRPIDPDTFATELREHLEPQNNANNRWIAEQAVAHDIVIQQYVDAGICPVRFGTILPSEQALLTLLERTHPDVKRTLTDLSGKKEWTLRVWLARDGLAPAPAQGGRAYLQARRATLTQLQQQRQQCDHYQHTINQWLQQTDIPFVMQDRRPADSNSQVGVCELVLLLSDEQVEQWSDYFAQDYVAQDYVADVGSDTNSDAEKLEHTLSGPFAPYHFSHFEAVIDK
jgi:hypothetical protein